MGVLSNKIDREELNPGDHIYSWRHAHIYARHGHVLYFYLLVIRFNFASIIVFIGVYKLLQEHRLMGFSLIVWFSRIWNPLHIVLLIIGDNCCNILFSIINVRRFRLFCLLIRVSLGQICIYVVAYWSLGQLRSKLFSILCFGLWVELSSRNICSHSWMNFWGINE